MSASSFFPLRAKSSLFPFLPVVAFTHSKIYAHSLSWSNRVHSPFLFLSLFLSPLLGRGTSSFSSFPSFVFFFPLRRKKWVFFFPLLLLTPSLSLFLYTSISSVVFMAENHPLPFFPLSPFPEFFFFLFLPQKVSPSK